MRVLFISHKTASEERPSWGLTMNQLPLVHSLRRIEDCR